ncbi:thiolase domain-containing protein [Candidatus Gottesmanbacteria bacterium]|nr:thiolase domain-containing protein [Candidatus Gottesmanbacteria bacterium]
MNKIHILGTATTKFGELWNISPKTLIKEAATEALNESFLTIDQIDAIFVGNMLSGILGGQEHLGAFVAEELGANIPAFKIEGACASGGLAMHNAYLSIASEIYKNVLVVGIEKMTDHKPEETTTALMGAGSDQERVAGATFPSLYALMARAHMKEYGTTEEQMAAVSVKNHYHASLNGKAQFPFTITIEQVLNSPTIASPLKLLDCSPVSDGAAAVVISTDTNKRSRITPVWIAASAVATDTLALHHRKSLTTIESARLAAKKAYKMAGVNPEDIDIAEVHDCFSIAEIIAMEDLEFFPKGKAGKAIAQGKTRLGSRLVVNTSGGLKASGHPVGATGVKQVVELVKQLRGQAGKKQVKNAKIGLTHNVGGSGATAVIHILRC